MKDNKNRSLLMREIENENHENINKLITAGADINTQNDIGETPLHYTIKHFDNQTFDILLEKNCDINIKNLNEQTPLHYAVGFNHPGMIKMLLTKKANPNDKDADGNTALHLSIVLENYYNSRLISDLLLDHYVDVSIKNKLGNTALHHLILHSSSDSEISQIESMLLAGANINELNDQGLSPLHFAAIPGRLHFFHYLLGKGADINIEYDGNTPWKIITESYKDFNDKDRYYFKYIEDFILNQVINQGTEKS